MSASSAKGSKDRPVISPCEGGPACEPLTLEWLSDFWRSFASSPWPLPSVFQCPDDQTFAPDMAGSGAAPLPHAKTPIQQSG